jgi:hypothetical protein
MRDECSPRLAACSPRLASVRRGVGGIDAGIVAEMDVRSLVGDDGHKLALISLDLSMDTNRALGCVLAPRPMVALALV